MELLSQMSAWHWLIAGGVLLALELLGAAGYLLWLGMAALCVSALQATAPSPGRPSGCSSPCWVSALPPSGGAGNGAC